MATFHGKVCGNGYLNLRATPSTSSSSLAHLDVNTSLDVEEITGNTEWFKTTYEGMTGYVVARYIKIENDGGTVQVVTSSGSLNIRKKPSLNDSVIYTAAQNSILRLINYTAVSDWYRVSNANGTGWAKKEFLTILTYPDGSGSNPEPISTYYYNASNAVTYALNHSENSSGVCSVRNTTFATIDGNSDCADFAHQCICAGGVPMFNGWFYSLSGIPSSWTNSKWQVTFSGLQRLMNKGWVEEVAYNAIQPGDLIYTYDENASPTPYTHVTIAVTYNLTVNGNYGCRVCGCTQNQNQAFKKLTATNCKCYRVNNILLGDGTEKSVYLPLSGNGGYVIS